jgi:hypothetical protein
MIVVGSSAAGDEEGQGRDADNVEHDAEHAPDPRAIGMPSAVLPRRPSPHGGTPPGDPADGDMHAEDKPQGAIAPDVRLMNSTDYRQLRNGT